MHCGVEKKGLFASCVVEKRYWPKGTEEEEVLGQMAGKDAGTTNIREGVCYNKVNQKCLLLLHELISKLCHYFI